ncbi:hypothetical protein HAX54_046843, partial [Datura stramonium]|nr:hypothetical protein [Datura stramonium]
CLFMGVIDMCEIDLGTTTFGNSLVRSGKTPMECRSNFKVGFRPLIRSCVTLVVCGSGPVTHCLTA